MSGRAPISSEHVANSSTSGQETPTEMTAFMLHMSSVSCPPRCPTAFSHQPFAAARAPTRPQRPRRWCHLRCHRQRAQLRCSNLCSIRYLSHLTANRVRHGTRSLQGEMTQLAQNDATTSLRLHVACIETANKYQCHHGKGCRLDVLHENSARPLLDTLLDILGRLLSLHSSGREFREILIP